jgi:hypothetical protein
MGKRPTTITQWNRGSKALKRFRRGELASSLIAEKLFTSLNGAAHGRIRQMRRVKASPSRML